MKSSLPVSRFVRAVTPLGVAFTACLGAVAATSNQNSASTSASPAAPLTVTAETPDVATVVQRELAARLPRSDGQIRVEGSDGHLVLRGEVEIYPDRVRAQEIAEGIRGVQEVTNELSVNPRSDIADDQIARSVRTSLDADGALADLAIDVAVTDGVVTLKGKVNADPQRRVAGWLASRIRGVTGLNNRLEVVPERRPDAEIQRQLARHFETSPVFDDDMLEVEVRDGVVRLTGAVDNALERNWAQSDAWVAGVRQVDAADLELSFDPAPLRSATRGAGITDQDIREAIHQLYVFDPRINSFRPDISVHDGVVTLSGVVSNPKAKQAAVQIARHAGGVADVIDRLEVRPSEPRDDDSITAALRVALRDNAVVEAAAIEIEVTNRRVVLTGQTDTVFEKWTAGDLAERTDGVTAVDNRIVVGNDVAGHSDYYYPTGQALQPWFPTLRTVIRARSDDELADEVRSALAENATTDGLNLEVEVERGVVTLRGDITSSSDRRAAVRVATETGANEVIDQLSIAATE